MLSAQAGTGRFRTCLTSSVWMSTVTAPHWFIFRRVKKLRWDFLPIPSPNKRKMWFPSEMFEEVILSQTPWTFSFDFDLFNWLVFTKVHTNSYFFFFHVYVWYSWMCVCVSACVWEDTCLSMQVCKLRAKALLLGYLVKLLSPPFITEAISLT